jgi:hypothetical protein
MRSSGGLAAFAKLAAVALVVVGCGRSSLIGSGGTDCPPGAHCVPGDMAGVDGGRDMSLDMRPSDMLDMRPSDMRGDMRPGDMRVDGGNPECGVTIPCTDPRCESDPHCHKPGQEICNNGIDDDDNGLIDCADPACFNDPFCKGDMAGGCFDASGNVDCNKPGCNTLPQCLHQTCQPEIDFGTVTPHDYDQTRTFDTRGATASYDTCAFPGGTARVGQFTLTATSDVRLDFAQPQGAAHVVVVARAGFGQACDANQLTCIKAGQAATASQDFPALAAGTYYVIVQSYPGTQGATTVRITTGHGVEICDNGVDDDGNGLIDCADQACANAPNCVDQECKPELNLGAIVVDAPAKTADFDTHTTSNRYHPTCAGSSTGNDYAVKFTLHETAGVLVQWTQGTGADHVITIFRMPPPGQACDASQMSCYYPGGESGGTVAFQPRPAGDYVFIFKAIHSGAEGPMHISVSAFKNRQMEICNNGIDDDGNGLVDCDDPACYGVGTCKPPICTPDVDLGDFVWGTQASTTLDVTTGTNYYTARCAKGGGKSKVVRVHLQQPMGLGYACNESGSQVLQLTQLINPLDACDANPVNCADPSVLPFGCNFVMPNLQPGVYDVLVEAFAAGDEGTVNLSLFGVQEKTLEICNNGIDDDGDGKIDCADLKCVTSPYCQKFQCRPDATLGLVPLDGTTRSTTVQTANNGDKFAASCASASGGQDAVVDFQVPAKANLKIDWAQAGNHVFAIYQDVNDLAACDQGPLVVCTPSMGQSTGSINLTALAGGKYYLIVDADHPGAEGGVVVQVSGAPAP